MQYQIGTEEPRNVVGSRAAKSESLAEAMEEARQKSRQSWIKEAWLREFSPTSGLGPVIARFVKGKQK